METEHFKIRTNEKYCGNIGRGIPWLESGGNILRRRETGVINLTTNELHYGNQVKATCHKLQGKYIELPGPHPKRWGNRVRQVTKPALGGGEGKGSKKKSLRLRHRDAGRRSGLRRERSLTTEERSTGWVSGEPYFTIKKCGRKAKYWGGTQEKVLSKKLLS